MALRVPDSIQICKKLTDSDLLKPIQFDFYLLSHPNIKPYIKCIANTNEETRNIEHSNIKRQLYSLLVTIKRLKYNLTQEKKQIELDQSEKLEYIKNQINCNSFDFSIYCICKKLHAKKLQKVSIQLFYLDQKQIDITAILDLLDDDFLKGIAINVLPSFFDLEKNSEKKIQILDSKINSLSCSFDNQMKIEMSKDLFVHESFLLFDLFNNDFDIYFSKIQKEVSIAKENTEPFPFLSYGDYLYKIIPRIYSTEISKIINASQETRPFELYNFCHKIIPNQKSLNENEHCISFVLIYRTVFEFIFNTRKDLFKNDLHTNKLIKKFSDIAELPISQFSFPKYINIPDPNENICVYCRNHPMLSQAIDFIQLTLFATNPIDALFCFEKSLSTINTIICSLNHDENVTCFDDAFALFIGAVISSDQTNIFYLSQLMNQYLDMFALTPPLEHALTTVEAVSKYLTSFDFLTPDSNV